MDKELQRRVDEVNKEMLIEDDESQSEPEELQKPIDFYQAQQNASYEASKRPRAYGSPAQMAIVVDKMLDNFRQEHYNISRNLYNHLMDVENRDNAEYLRQKYMTQEALPLVESFVETYGVDAVLNSPRVLKGLDSIMITPNGSGDGFTKAYLRQMHKGQAGEPSTSDAKLAYGMAKVRALADSDDIRGAVSMAKSLKKKVDEGELSASEKDYITRRY